MTARRGCPLGTPCAGKLVPIPEGPSPSGRDLVQHRRSRLQERAVALRLLLLLQGGGSSVGAPGPRLRTETGTEPGLGRSARENGGNLRVPPGGEGAKPQGRQPWTLLSCWGAPWGQRCLPEPVLTQRSQVVRSADTSAERLRVQCRDWRDIYNKTVRIPEDIFSSSCFLNIAHGSALPSIISSLWHLRKFKVKLEKKGKR